MIPRPARSLFPVALLPVPAWWQTQCFPSEYPHKQLPWTDLHEIASRVPSWWTGTGRPLPVVLFPLPVGPRGRRRKPTWKVDKIMGAIKVTRIFHVENANFSGGYSKLRWELEFMPNLTNDRITLIITVISRLKMLIFTIFLRGNGKINLSIRIGNQTGTFSGNFPGCFYATLFQTIYTLMLLNLRMFTSD